MPKQLIPIANRPVLLHIMDNLRALGVREVGVVVGDRRDEIAAALGDGAAVGLEVTYIRQEAPLGLAHGVRIARDFLGDDDFVLYLGDVMLTDGVVEMAERFARRRPTAQVVVQKVADPRAFGLVETDADGRVTELAEKPEHPRGDLAMVGVYFFTPAVHGAVDAIGPSARGELEITDALRWLVTEGHEVRAEVYPGFWKDTGRVEDIFECNREVLGRLRRSVAGTVCPDSELVGDVVLDPTARVTRSRIVGPAVVGAGTVVSDSQIGPYTAIGDGCVLSGTCVADSIVLAEATVRDVPGIHGSVIGRGAAVSSGGARHRLLVGDDTQVEVAV
jgi:glucose-1-phosphate thymidylyltransferase